MTPRSQALAFRIWVAAEAVGWDCTVREIAESIDAPSRAVGRVVAAKGWGTRFRAPGARWEPSSGLGVLLAETSQVTREIRQTLTGDW